MKVKVRNPLAKAGIGRQEYTHEGEPVAVPKWVDYEAIALTTNEYKFPVRIIPKDWIVEIDDSAFIKKAESSTNRSFTVAGSNSNTYTVTINGKNKSCTCPAFQFRRSCKHIVGIE